MVLVWCGSGTGVDSQISGHIGKIPLKLLQLLRVYVPFLPAAVS